MTATPEACRDRKWLSVADATATTTTGQPSAERSFTIMNYNLLCQQLIRRTLFPYASQNSLKWKSRKGKLLAEISHWKADIMCLQEVGIEHWHQVFAQHFKQLGYDSRLFFSMKKTHGVAILWKRSKFHLVDELSVRMDSSMDVCGETLQTDNVGLVAALRFGSAASAECADPYADSVDPEYRIAGNGSSASGDDGVKGIIVSNTHLFWLPGACYERLQQQIAMLAAQRAMQAKHPGFAVISCGDFNTTPDDAGYALLTKTRPVTLNEWQLDNLLPTTLVDEDVEEEGGSGATSSSLSYADMASAGTPSESDSTSNKRRKLEEEERQAEADFVRDQERVQRLVKHIQAENAPLRSCYSTYADLDVAYRTEQWPGEPVFTNYAKWKGTLDYIFFRPGQGLHAQAVMSLPAERHMKPGLPNETFPSDHVALLARFGVA
ncbi:RNA exonuclease ngl2 [Coemansia sp. RSA 2424]|nr:RNA exonuclease ngl2 [Coemansia sp. RSA 2424]